MSKLKYTEKQAGVMRHLWICGQSYKAIGRIFGCADLTAKKYIHPEIRDTHNARTQAWRDQDREHARAVGRRNQKDRIARIGKDEINRQRREYWAKPENRERKRERDAAWRSDPDNKAKKAASDKAYREANAERVAEKNREWAAANRDRVNAASRAYAERNPEKVRDAVRASMRKNPEHYRRKVRERRAKGGSWEKYNGIPRWIVLRMLRERDGERCRRCGVLIVNWRGRDGVNIDHIRPVNPPPGEEHGMTPEQLNHIDNLQLMHSTCNNSKGNRSGDLT